MNYIKKALRKILISMIFLYIKLRCSYRGKKHFWVGKLIESKIELEKLKKEKEEKIKNINDNYKPEIAVSKATLNKQINNLPSISLLNDKIYELEIIIEYLEKVEKIFSSTSYDLRNIIELKKMEEL